MPNEFSIPDLDDLIDEQEQNKGSSHSVSESVNFLFIGRKALSDKLFPYLEKYDTNINFHYSPNIEDAIDLLLVDIYAIVMLDNEDTEMDIITLSRIVRVNHPLARIVALSNSRRSLFIADIINHGSVDAYLPLPVDEHELMSILAEQQAKHEIDKMLTKFVSQPPELSAASYLLLDPSLSADENEPVKFVGMMVAYRSVPRFSKYFEDLLAKDEILFAGYLSGITMLGQELLKSDDPLKEINFGGISVIFRFNNDIQFSIFVRNLSKHNVDRAETVINSVLTELMEEAGDEIASTDRPSNETLDEMDDIVDKFKEANEVVEYSTEMEFNRSSYKGHRVVLYGTDEEEMRKIKEYLSPQVEYNITYFVNEKEAKEFIRINEISVLIIDSDINNTPGQSPLDFADFVKDDYPFSQVIYQVRDRRASGPIIRSLNSGAINFLISYRATRKDLNSWIEKAIEKVIEIRDQSSKGEVDNGLNAALAAKTKIRENEDSYLTENPPQMNGIFITNDETPIFKRFWNPLSEDLDESMLAGMVASLESVGDEMFYDDGSIGGIELGNSNLMVEHRAKFNIVYFINNIRASTSKIVGKEVHEFSDTIYSSLSQFDNYESVEVKSVLDTITNKIYSAFTEKFTHTMKPT